MSATPTSLHQDILRYIANANDLLSRGEIASLSGLDTAVEELCNRVLTLDEKEVAQFVPELDALMQALDTLQARMKQARDACRVDVESLGKHHRAASAYGANKKPK